MSNKGRSLDSSVKSALNYVYVQLLEMFMLIMEFRVKHSHCAPHVMAEHVIPTPLALVLLQQLLVFWEGFDQWRGTATDVGQ